MWGKKKTGASLPRRRKGESISQGKAVFSYYSSGETVQEGALVRKPKKELTKIQKLAILYSFAGIFLVFVIFSTTLSTNPAASITGDVKAYQSTDVYAARAHELLALHTGSLSKFTVNTMEVENRLTKDYPELLQVRLSLPVIGRRPKLILSFRRPAVVLSTGTGALVVDGQGRAVAKLADVKTEVTTDLPTVEDSNNLPLKVGDQVLTSGSVKFIEAAVAQLKAKSLEVERLTLPNVPNELDIRIKGQGYYIKCDLTGEARVQVGGYLAVRAQGVTPVEYVDVRVEEKVFYK